MTENNEERDCSMSLAQLRLIREAMLSYLANQRVGTAKTKTRAEVQGASRKLYKQKGTGRARAGNRRTPVRVGGGHAFAKRPREWRKDLPKKMRQGAIRAALAYRIRCGEVKRITLPSDGVPCTKRLLSWLNGNGVSGAALIVTAGLRSDLHLSARSIPNIRVTDWRNLNINDIVLSSTVLVDQGIQELNDFGSN